MKTTIPHCREGADKARAFARLGVKPEEGINP